MAAGWHYGYQALWHYARNNGPGDTWVCGRGNADGMHVQDYPDSRGKLCQGCKQITGIPDRQQGPVPSGKYPEFGVSMAAEDQEGKSISVGDRVRWRRYGENYEGRVSRIEEDGPSSWRLYLDGGQTNVAANIVQKMSVSMARSNKCGICGNVADLNSSDRFQGHQDNNGQNCKGSGKYPRETKMDHVSEREDTLYDRSAKCPYCSKTVTMSAGRLGDHRSPGGPCLGAGRQVGRVVECVAEFADTRTAKDSKGQEIRTGDTVTIPSSAYFPNEVRKGKIAWIDNYGEVSVDIGYSSNAVFPANQVTKMSSSFATDNERWRWEVSYRDNTNGSTGWLHWVARNEDEIRREWKEGSTFGPILNIRRIERA